MSTKSKILLAASITTIIAVVLILTFGPWKGGEGSFRVGAILPLTGPAAPFGESSKNALLMAEEEINADHKLPRIELLVEDGMADPKSSLSAFRRLHDLKGVRYMMTLVSGVAMALAPAADEEGVLLFANASHPQITRDRDLVLRYSNLTSDEVRTVINFISEKHADWNRMHVIAINDDYGRVYSAELKATAAIKSQIVLAGTEFYDRDTTDFRTLATAVVAKKPDVVVVVGYGRSMGVCVRQLRELGYAGPFVASLGFVITGDAAKAAGNAVKGGYLVNFAFVNNKGALDFRDRYIKRYGKEPSPNAVIDYSTMYLLAHSIGKVGAEPTALARYLKGLGQVTLPTGAVAINPQGDIVAPVSVVPIPSSGVVKLWDVQQEEL